MPECLDKNTSKITASIFLNFFSENSQVVASRHLPQHGAARKTDPSQSNQTQKIGFGPRFLVAKREEIGFLPSLQGQIGGMLPDTARPSRSLLSTPLLLLQVRSDRWSVVEWISTNGRFSKNHQLTAFQIQAVQPSWGEKVANVCQKWKVEGINKKKAEDMRSVNVWYKHCASLALHGNVQSLHLYSK